MDYDREYDSRTPKSCSFNGAANQQNISAKGSEEASSEGISNRKRPGKTGSTGTSGSSTRPKSTGSAGTTAPKVYNPILEVDDDICEVKVVKGESATFSFTVRHVSGDLPPSVAAWNEALGRFPERSKDNSGSRKTVSRLKFLSLFPMLKSEPTMVHLNSS